MEVLELKALDYLIVLLLVTGLGIGWVTLVENPDFIYHQHKDR